MSPRPSSPWVCRCTTPTGSQATPTTASHSMVTVHTSAYQPLRWLCRTRPLPVSAQNIYSWTRITEPARRKVQNLFHFWKYFWPDIISDTRPVIPTMTAQNTVLPSTVPGTREWSTKTVLTMILSIVLLCSIVVSWQALKLFQAHIRFGCVLFKLVSAF